MEPLAAISYVLHSGPFEALQAIPVFNDIFHFALRLNEESAWRALRQGA